MTDSTETRSPLASRRALVGGVVGLGVGAPILVACGSDESGSGSSGDSGSSDSGGDSGSSSSSGAIAKTSDIPEGGGKIFESEKVVITQPTAGEFKAFSAVCTHQQCLVTKISDGDIDCTCHGSKFSIEDGSVVEGPANEPLESMTATVSGEEITVS